MNPYYYRLPDGESVLIDVCEVDWTVSVTTEEGISIGQFLFDDCSDESGDGLRLVNMHLEGCGKRFRRKGIGREILRIVREKSGMAILASDHDGIRRNDGSHLTGDGPGFVEIMRREGLIAPSASYDEQDEVKR